MKLQPCGCQDARYFRIPRRWWMRLLSERRLYECQQCHALMFLPQAIGARHAYSSVDTLPAPVARQ
jgi:hypothetical protein